MALSVDTPRERQPHQLQGRRVLPARFIVVAEHHATQLHRADPAGQVEGIDDTDPRVGEWRYVG